MRKTKKRGGANTSGGLLLVFDLDGTIANTKEPTELNPSITDIIIEAANLRGNNVDAICLLTNNSDKDYIAFIDDIFLTNLTSNLLRNPTDGTFNIGTDFVSSVSKIAIP